MTYIAGLFIGAFVTTLAWLWMLPIWRTKP
jgi:hypothetical protein